MRWKVPQPMSSESIEWKDSCRLEAICNTPELLWTLGTPKTTINLHCIFIQLPIMHFLDKEKWTTSPCNRLSTGPDPWELPPHRSLLSVFLPRSSQQKNIQNKSSLAHSWCNCQLKGGNEFFAPDLCQKNSFRTKCTSSVWNQGKLARQQEKQNHVHRSVSLACGQTSLSLTLKQILEKWDRKNPKIKFGNVCQLFFFKPPVITVPAPAGSAPWNLLCH